MFNLDRFTQPSPTTPSSKLAGAALTASLISGFFMAPGFMSVAQAEPSYYIGGAAGLSRVNDSDFDENNNAALKAFVGGKYNDYIGIEGAVNDYGQSGGSGYSADLTGNTLAIVGSYPLADRVEVFVKGGRLWWREKVVVLNTFSDTKTGDNTFYGVGANFTLTDAIALRAEIERYKAGTKIGNDIDGSAHVDVASIGVSMNF